MTDEPLQIVVIHFSNPASYPPLMNAIRCFENEGWNVDVFSAPRGGSEMVKPPPDLCANFHSLTLKLFSSPKVIAFILFVKIIWFLYKNKCSILYVSDPHACIIACWICKYVKFPIIYHEHDTPGQNSSKVLQKSRKIIMNSAFAVVVPNRKRLSKNIDVPVIEVMNVPSVKELKFRDLSLQKKHLKVYYHGSINKNRLPAILVTAIKNIKQEKKLLVVGYETIGSQGYKKYLSELATRNNVQLEFQGPYCHRKCLEVAACQSVGICFYQGSGDINFKHMWGASNKIYDYLSSGLALLVEDRQEFRAGFEGLYLPVVFVDSSNENSIIEGLGEISKIPDEYYQNIPKIMNHLWNYEHQYSPVIQFIKELERC